MITDHALLIGKVWHRRLRPVEHTFSYPFLWLWINLDDVDGLLSRNRWWGRRFRPAVLRESDYLDGAEGRLRDRLVPAAQRLGLDWRVGTVCLMSQPRLWGWLFNPLTLYWHFPQGSDAADSVIAEVHNTPWHQRHWYALDLAQPAEQGLAHAKAFHVSPFMPMEQTYRWHLQMTSEQARIGIDTDDDRGNIFSAGVNLRRVEATSASMAGAIRRFGAQGLKVSAAIYYQAWRLWRKGVPFIAHPDRQRAPEQKP